MRLKRPKNNALHTIVEYRDTRTVSSTPISGDLHGYPRGQLKTIHGRPVSRFLDQPLVVKVHRGHHSIHDPLRPDMTNETACIYAADAHQVMPAS